MQIQRVQQVQPWIGRPETEAIEACLERNWLTEGPAAAAFRQNLGQLTG